MISTYLLRPMSSPSYPGENLYLIGEYKGFSPYLQSFEHVLASLLTGVTSQQRREEALSVGTFYHQLAHIVLLGLENKELDKGESMVIYTI